METISPKFNSHTVIFFGGERKGLITPLPETSNLSLNPLHLMDLKDLNSLLVGTCLLSS